MDFLIIVPLLNMAMFPSKDRSCWSWSKIINQPEEIAVDTSKMTPAEKIENSKVVSILLSIMGFVYIVYYLMTKGFALNLNIVNFIFLFLGILLHGTQEEYLNTLEKQ